MIDADPSAGDPHGIRLSARDLGDHVGDLRRGSHTIDDAAARAESDWRGKTQRSFLAAASMLRAACGRVAQRVEHVAAALDEYGRAVKAIQDEARVLRRLQDNAEADAIRAARAQATAMGDDDPRSLARLRADVDRIAAQRSRYDAMWADLVERRARADRRAASMLASADVLGGLATVRAGSRSGGGVGMLAALATLPPELVGSAASDSEFVDLLADSSVATITAWWDSLGADARWLLIATIPGVIGNLAGVPYRARDRANRVAVDRAWFASAAAVERADERRSSAKDSQAWLEAQREYDAAVDYRARLTNFRAGARTHLNVAGEVPRQLVSFHPGSPPLGAWAIGDLDTAANVSYLVPGMGTTLADTTKLMRAASNVMAMQDRITDRSTAIVTWIGYETPPNALTTGDPAVLGNGYAERGAPALASDLSTLRSLRPDVELNVIAHSYGSTTASLALADHEDLDVHAFVTLGSAGIPQQVPDAAATHAEHMYAAQAEERWNVAKIGREFSFPHRLDPTWDFGATVIDAGTVHGSFPVNVHDLFKGNVASDGSGDHGYLDAETNSLRETAQATVR
jgi:uncharacterized protein YukE